jgi:hypothetical protein
MRSIGKRRERRSHGRPSRSRARRLTSIPIPCSRCRCASIGVSPGRRRAGQRGRYREWFLPFASRARVLISSNGGRASDRGRMHQNSPYRRRRPGLALLLHCPPASDGRCCGFLPAASITVERDHRRRLSDAVDAGRDVREHQERAPARPLAPGGREMKTTGAGINRAGP